MNKRELMYLLLGLGLLGILTVAAGFAAGREEATLAGIDLFPDHHHTEEVCVDGQEWTVIYEESFESGPAGWTTSGIGNSWSLNDVGYMGEIAWLASGPMSVSDQRLESPQIALPSIYDSFRLHFYNQQSIESSGGGVGCYDGAVVEISTDNGNTWNHIPNDRLLTDHYDGPVSSSHSNPLAGRFAWCGDPQAYLDSVVNLDAYAGQDVRVRFRFASDSSVASSGWAVDSARIYACQDSPSLPAQTVNTDIGVIPGPGGCSGAVETVAMRMDDENNANANYSTGWTGAIGQDDDVTNLVFCRLPGSEFKHWESTGYDMPPQPETAYAVLKLGDQCPNGSSSFSRYFDNEDDDNRNASEGDIYPNRSNRNTRLEFCLFDAVEHHPNFETMSAFPQFSFEYGVFAASSFEGALETGLVHTDDEDTNNANTRDVSYVISPAVPVLDQIVSDGIGTNLRLAKVYVPGWALTDPNPCGAAGAFCEARPRPVDLSISLYHAPCRDEMSSDCLAYKSLIESFADVVYEMSNGVHRLADVWLIQPGAEALEPDNDDVGHWPGADIQWLERRSRLWADISGIRNDNWYLYFADIWEQDRDLEFLSSGLLQEMGSRSLAHEWGHYYYGLYDEYPHIPGDVDVANSVMSGLSYYTNASDEIIDFDREFEFSDISNFNRNNSQYRAFGASAWETLSRPPSEDRRPLEPPAGGWPRNTCSWWQKVFEGCQDDPLDYRTRWVPVEVEREHYPELASVDPGDDGPLPPNLPDPRAQEILDIKPRFGGGGEFLVEEDQQTHLGGAEIDFAVDDGADRIDTWIRWPGPTASGPGDISLRDPSGAIHAPVDCSTAAYQLLKEPECGTSVLQPAPGEWTLIIEVPSPPLLIEHEIAVVSTDAPPRYDASIRVPQGTLVSYPQPVMVVAQVTGNLPITGAGLDAHYEAPDGQEYVLSLNDDGLEPDVLAQDGLYSGYLDYDQNGMHNISVFFDNDAGNAVYTERRLEDGGETMEAVGENFHRGATLTVEVLNVSDDDHGDTAEEATPLDPENLDLPGRIDFAGDTDLFIVLPVESSQLIARVTSLGMGMEPRMRILEGADCDELVNDVLYLPGSLQYPWATVDATAGVPFCIEVSHRDPNASEGLYYVSVGPALGSDGQSQRLYLPTILRGTSAVRR